MSEEAIQKIAFTQMFRALKAELKLKELIFENEELKADRQDLAKAVLAYGSALISCANDPSKMSSFCTAQDESLDILYLSLVEKAKHFLGVDATMPNNT